MQRIGVKVQKLNLKHPAKEELKINKRTAICRCWQSKKFPICDGSHNEFNEQNQQKLGPLIVEHNDS